MATPTEPFSRPLRLASTDEPRSFDVRATPAECAAVRALLDVGAVEGLRIAGEIAAVGEGWQLRAAIDATVVQSCVVSFEPVRQEVVAEVERSFVLGAAAAPAIWDIDPAEHDIDHLEEPVVDVGAVAVEELALNLEPYPRAPEADALLAEHRRDEAPAGPFAVLARHRARP